MSTDLQPGARVVVNIVHPEHFAMGAAACLHGATGSVEKIADGGRSILVAFDEARPKWWTHQTPATGFWFEPTDLQPTE